MSLIFATQLTAVATVALAALALATAVLALLAWRKQSREVSDQAEMLKLQQETSEKQAGVLELQAAELRKSLEERSREGQRRAREQAILVFLTENRHKGRLAGPLDSALPSITATVVNSSNQPIYDTDVYWSIGEALNARPEPPRRNPARQVGQHHSPIPVTHRPQYLPRRSHLPRQRQLDVAAPGRRLPRLPPSPRRPMAIPQRRLPERRRLRGRNRLRRAFTLYGPDAARTRETLLIILKMGPKATRTCGGRWRFAAPRMLA